MKIHLYSGWGITLLYGMRRQDPALATEYSVTVLTDRGLSVEIRADYPSGRNFSAPEKSLALARFEKTKGKIGTRGYRTFVEAGGWILVALADWLEGREAAA